MAVVTVKSGAITNRDATPRVLNNPVLERGICYIATATVTITNGDSIASKYLLFQIPSGARVQKIEFWAPDIGTTVAADLGIWRTTADGGAVVDADFFASAVSFASGPYNAVDVTFEALAAGGSIANGEKRVWEANGASVDPFVAYDVVWQLTAAADATGTITTRIYWTE